MTTKQPNPTNPLNSWCQALSRPVFMAVILIDLSKGVMLDLNPGDVAVFSGFTPHRSAANKSAQSRRLLCLSYNADSDGGDQREAHYREYEG